MIEKKNKKKTDEMIHACQKPTKLTFISHLVPVTDHITCLGLSFSCCTVVWFSSKYNVYTKTSIVYTMNHLCHFYTDWSLTISYCGMNTIESNCSSVTFCLPVIKLIVKIHRPVEKYFNYNVVYFCSCTKTIHWLWAI